MLLPYLFNCDTECYLFYIIMCFIFCHVHCRSLCWGCGHYGCRLQWCDISQCNVFLSQDCFELCWSGKRKFLIECTVSIWPFYSLIKLLISPFWIPYIPLCMIMKTMIIIPYYVILFSCTVYSNPLWVCLFWCCAYSYWDL